MLHRVICEDMTTLSRVAAELAHSAILQALAARGVARVALSGGTTPRGAYRLLAGLPFDRDRVHWFWVDERSVPPTSERSNFAMARDELLAPAGIPPERIFRMEAERQPIEQAASHYADRLLQEFGMSASVALGLDGAGRSPLAFDLIVAGIGLDGHTASLFSGTGAALREDALVVALAPGGGLEPRVSLTRPVLLGARRLLVLCAGKEKRVAIAAATSPGPEDQVPARIFQRAGPGAALLLLDRAAAG